MTVKVGSVIQVKENNPMWGGCLMIVQEVKPWGVQCYMRLPFQGELRTTYLRLNHSEYYLIGEAALVEGENE